MLRTKLAKRSKDAPPEEVFTSSEPEKAVVAKRKLLAPTDTVRAVSPRPKQGSTELIGALRTKLAKRSKDAPPEEVFTSNEPEKAVAASRNLLAPAHPLAGRVVRPKNTGQRAQSEAISAGPIAETTMGTPQVTTDLSVETADALISSVAADFELLPSESISFDAADALIAAAAEDRKDL